MKDYEIVQYTIEDLAVVKEITVKVESKDKVDGSRMMSILTRREFRPKDRQEEIFITDDGDTAVLFDKMNKNKLKKMSLDGSGTVDELSRELNQGRKKTMEFILNSMLQNSETLIW